MHLVVILMIILAIGPNIQAPLAMPEVRPLHLRLEIILIWVPAGMVEIFDLEIFAREIKEMRHLLYGQVKLLLKVPILQVP